MSFAISRGRVANIAAYKFVTLDELPALRDQVRERALALGIKGTVLLAPEGINLFLAGASEAVEGFLQWLRGDARFADLQVKASESDTVPFGKMLVKIKREIIRMDHPAIRPEAGRAPGVDGPKTVSQELSLSA